MKRILNYIQQKKAIKKVSNRQFYRNETFLRL